MFHLDLIMPLEKAACSGSFFVWEMGLSPCISGAGVIYFEEGFGVQPHFGMERFGCGCPSKTKEVVPCKKEHLV